MALKITLSDFTGTVKKLAANKVYLPMTSTSLWYHADASTMVKDELFNIANKDWVVWEKGDTIDVKFTADDTGVDGQGFYIQGGNVFDWEVRSVNGTVKKVRAKNILASDDKKDLYSSSSASTAAVGDVLEYMDAIVCNKTGDFTVRIKINSELSGTFMAMGIVQVGIQE